MLTQKGMIGIQGAESTNETGDAKLEHAIPARYEDSILQNQSVAALEIELCNSSPRFPNNITSSEHNLDSRGERFS